MPGAESQHKEMQGCHLTEALETLVFRATSSVVCHLLLLALDAVLQAERRLGHFQTVFGDSDVLTRISFLLCMICK